MSQDALLVKRDIKKEKMREKRKQNRVLSRQRKKLIAKSSSFSSKDESDAYVITMQSKKEAMEEKMVVLIDNMACGQRICVDLSFDMTDSETNSVCKQLCLTFNSLKRSLVPLSWHITSMSTSLESILNDRCGIKKWPVTVNNKSFSECFSLEDLVVLSPDASEVITSFDPQKVYIIGGIADRTVRKNLSLDLARQMGIPAVRLPIQEYLPSRRTHILNIDTVFTIIWRYMMCGDWSEVLTECVPQRTQGVAHKASGCDRIDEGSVPSQAHGEPVPALSSSCDESLKLNTIS